jgi:hypothetical protein
LLVPACERVCVCGGGGMGQQCLYVRVCAEGAAAASACHAHARPPPPPKQTPTQAHTCPPRALRTRDKLQQLREVLLVHLAHDLPEPLDDGAGRRVAVVLRVRAQVGHVDVWQPADKQLQLVVVEDGDELARDQLPEALQEGLRARVGGSCGQVRHARVAACASGASSGRRAALGADRCAARPPRRWGLSARTHTHGHARNEWWQASPPHPPTTTTTPATTPTTTHPRPHPHAPHTWICCLMLVVMRWRAMRLTYWRLLASVTRSSRPPGTSSRTSVLPKKSLSAVNVRSSTSVMSCSSIQRRFL